jgi:hypothetical protein
MGEEFIRHVFAHDVAARMAYRSITLAQALSEVVDSVLRPDDGGAIAVDSDYNIVMRFNSVGMYRGCADFRGRCEVAIYHKGGGGWGCAGAGAAGGGEEQRATRCGLHQPLAALMLRLQSAVGLAASRI